ncbi:MAG: hypothetical protein WC008_02320 [Bacilli bacterium]
MSFRAKISAITPLTCVATYLFLGFQFGLWKEGLVVFLLIPIMPILLGYKKLRFSVGFIITIIYLIMGFGFHYWHPGWIIFFLIPIIQILIAPSSKKWFKTKNDKTTIIDDENIL